MVVSYLWLLTQMCKYSRVNASVSVLFIEHVTVMWGE